MHTRPMLSRMMRRALAAVAGVLALSCGGSEPSGPSGPDPNAIASVTVSPTNAQIDVAGQTQLTATVRNNAGDIVSQSPSWSSSAQGVATVNANGLVTGVSEGQATITASLSGRSGQATVGVNDPNPPAAPSNLQAEAVSDEAIVLTWDDNSNNEDGFVIEREEGAAGAAPAAARVFMRGRRSGRERDHVP